MLAKLADWVDVPPLAVDGMVVLAAATTVLSGVHYVWVWGFGKEGIAKERG